MNWLFSWIIALLVTLPASFRVAEFSGKPVDIVGSDLLFLLLIFIPRRGDLVIPSGIVLRRFSIVRVTAAVALIYCLSIAGIAYAQSSELGRIVSAVKFAKPLAFVGLGAYIASVMSPLPTLRRIVIAFAGMSVATFATAVMTPGFPQVAWGKYLFGFPLYGYPNSAMTLFALMVPLLMAAADIRVTKIGKWVLRGIAMLTGMMVVLSLSRSSTAVMVIGVLIYLFLTGRVYLPLFAATMGIFLLASMSSMLDSVLGNHDVMMWVERLTRRTSQTVGGGDHLSGRGEIWAVTIDLWSARPMLGYQFESFSNFAEFDTPHQQYLEVLFKSGAIGLTLYMGVLLFAWSGLGHITRFTTPRTEAWYLFNGLIAGFTATMVGNLSQPNLTYSVTGNFLFFAVGLTLTKQMAAALVPPSQPEIPYEVARRSPFSPAIPNMRAT
ncbi:MAG: O-antigen ligase family protein [Planctomycetaceae bacterium]|nr:O-antigen ligase family protein [Planctomycetaceae bacterium]